jgi:photosystem II stability/assembly factor-like uncharacterized protein
MEVTNPWCLPRHRRRQKDPREIHVRRLRCAPVLYSLRLIAALLIVLSLASPARAQTVGSQPPDPVAASLFSDLKWRLIGPFRGGRAVAVGGVAGSGNTFYFGAVDGGVWKTDDAGTVWRPLFDGQPVASIGALDVSTSDPQVIYVGTGESDIRSDLASGAGIYKSHNGGDSWTYVGLKNTRQISRLLIDPTNADIVYVGALGDAYGPNPERGVYKTSDGGATWKHVLDRGPTTGVADLAIASQKPSVLFAALWNAHRPPWSTYAPIGGPGGALYRSLDAGETWAPCSGHGLPVGAWGRSGVAVSADGRRVYALIEADHSGLYVSDDGGDSWRLANDDARLTSRAWYFNRITVDPSDPDTIYMPNIALFGSVDGGKTITAIRGAPGGDDYHELWVDPKNRDRLIMGTDQGTIVSLNRGRTWSTWYNQPTAQLYHVITDDRFPYSVYGAEQDSGGVAVPSRTDHGEIASRDWFPASGSESGYFALDPRDPDILYVSSYYGSVFRWDRRRSLSQDVSPWPAPISDVDLTQRKYRAPWTPPLVFSPVEKTTLYFGTQFVLKTTDGGLHWTQISPDLTGAKPGATPPKTVTASTTPSAKTSAMVSSPTFYDAKAWGFGTLSTVAPAYGDPKVLWTGSDTGVVSLTRDGGVSWADVTPPRLPPWSKISLIEPSHTDAATAYVAVERHRVDDRTPYIYRTRNYGKTWDLITSGLRAPQFVLAVREDPAQRGMLFAGTEFGIAVSFDAGNHWQTLQLNLPVTSVRDMAIHGDDLIVGTHGRSIWILDDIAPLRQAAERAQSAGPFLYRPARAVRIDNDAFPGTPIPRDEPIASNPPAGAPLDYYLPRAAQSVTLHILDAEGHVLRGFTSDETPPPPHAPVPIAEQWFPAPPHLETTAGMHRFIWSLASGTSGEMAENAPDDGEGEVPRAPRVPPGTYTIELTVNKETVSREPLIVTDDPRSPATQSELTRQFETGTRMFRDALESRRALAEIASVMAKLDSTAAPGTNAAALKAINVRRAEIAAITDGPAGLKAAAAALASALHVVESSDREAPSQALAVYEYARSASQVKLEQWSALKTGGLTVLNHLFKRAGMPLVPIHDIEREIDRCVTR